MNWSRTGKCGGIVLRDTNVQGEENGFLKRYLVSSAFLNKSTVSCSVWEQVLSTGRHWDPQRSPWEASNLLWTESSAAIVTKPTERAFCFCVKDKCLWLLVWEGMEATVVFSLSSLLPLGMDTLEANAAGVLFPSKMAHRTDPSTQ